MGLLRHGRSAGFILPAGEHLHEGAGPGSLRKRQDLLPVSLRQRHARGNLIRPLMESEEIHAGVGRGQPCSH